MRRGSPFTALALYCAATHWPAVPREPRNLYGMDGLALNAADTLKLGSMEPAAGTIRLPAGTTIRARNA